MSDAPLIMPSISPAEKLTRCDAVAKLRGNPSDFGGSFARSLTSKANEADRALADAWRQDQATHAANLPAIRNNEMLRAQIVAVMRSAGIPDDFTERDPKSRAMFPKRIRRPAGYLGDLGRNVQIDDGFALAEKRYSELAVRFAEFRRKADAERAAAVSAKEDEVRRREADMEFAMVLVRHGLAASAAAADVLDELRKRDKHLDLAIAMEDVRGDWSGGCWRVSDALRRFTIESERDKNIAADVAEAIASFGDCQDGRVFRDCGWSYTELYKLVSDQQLVADARLARARDA